MSNGKRFKSPVPAHEISDKSKLLWKSYYDPMQAAAMQLNAAIQNTSNIIGESILRAEGFSPETHVFDIGRLVIVPRPKVTEK